ncbi:MAG: hypothetical protein J3K34DRAFT_519900 [Monoraphidium minutum]|nr:MAG: hypothetical protein J3K34DRAFT_519900 [Monoraphidium minutum]
MDEHTDEFIDESSEGEIVDDEGPMTAEDDDDGSLVEEEVSPWEEFDAAGHDEAQEEHAAEAEAEQLAAAVEQTFGGAAAAKLEAEASAAGAAAAAALEGAAAAVAPAATAAEAAAAKPSGLGGSLPPRGGLGLGLGGAKLPPKGTFASMRQQQPPAEQAQQQAPAEQAQPAQQQQPPAAPAAPAKPAGLGGLGLGGLGLKPKPAAAAGAASGAPAAAAGAPAAAAAEAPRWTVAGRTGSSQPPPAPGGAPPQQPAQQQPAAAPPAAPQQQQPPPAKPAAPSLPARPAGGLGGLPARPAPAAGASPALPGRPAPAAGAAPALPGRPALPARPAAAPGGGAVVAAAAAAPPAAAAGEPKKVQKARRELQELRVNLIRGAGRLGVPLTGDAVSQFLKVVDRIEEMTLPGPGRRPDAMRAAYSEANALNEQEGPDSRLGIGVKLLLVGLTGTGKSELANTLLGRPAARTSAFRETTKSVRVLRGDVRGIGLTIIDTPGLHASSDAALANRGALRAAARAYKRHKPDFVIYVDRLDAARPSFGELSTLTQLGEVLGKGVWRSLMVVLTHANAAREQMGGEYGQTMKQRRNILGNIMRQVSGEAQLKTPTFLADCHPEGPRNASGQPVVWDVAGGMVGALTPTPWREQLLMQLLGYAVYHRAQDATAAASAKPKGKPAAAALTQQQQMMQRMKRSRMPPTSYFVEQLVEGVLKPDTYATVEDPFDRETDDEEAEEFNTSYYQLMRGWAKRGDPVAQKEYAAWLRKLARARRAYAEAYRNEDNETLAAYGYEGYVAEGLDLGPTFDPEDVTDHRYQYVVTDNEVAIMPTLDYYGFEHEDAITGFVAEWCGQPFNRNGWGGVPLDATVTVEKDKANLCLQGEAHASVVHNIKPFGSKHITQVGGAFEVLRPNIKDVLYTLEVNSFRDGLLRANDHAGVGMLVSRMAEGGDPRKGPHSVGLRLQDTLRVGPLKVEAVAAQVRGESPQGGRDEAWGSRAFLMHDWIPGVGLNLDFYSQRTRLGEDPVGGWAAAACYDFEVAGMACGTQIDYVGGSGVMHVDMSVFGGRNYRLAWLLLLPAANFLKDKWRSWFGRGGGEEEMEEEGEEEEAGGADLASMFGAGGLQGIDPAALQQLLQSGMLQGMRGM